MKDNRILFQVVLAYVVLLALVVGLSFLSNRLWGGKPEESSKPLSFVMEEGMSVGEFGRTNDLPNKVLKDIFDLQSKIDLEKKLADFGSPEQVSAMVLKKMALDSEHASKNWVKIPVKFGSWFAFLSAVFWGLRNHRITPRLRKSLLFFSVAVFGIVLGADPSPMGTVKDAVHLYGTTGAIFPPRMVALGVFLFIVFLANKYICAWGCQAGTLQDLIFRLNQSDKRKAVIGRQFKLPFSVTNTVRVSFFCVFTFAVFAWGVDIIDPIDPFKVFKPAVLGIFGGIFLGILLLLSLFVYRPWCHLCCPFGLVGWFVEKVSIVRVSVDYATCIACGECARACPSTVMDAILRRHTKTIPDCFSCYTCRDTCPTGSIIFSKRRRTLPPLGHFDSKRKRNAR